MSNRKWTIYASVLAIACGAAASGLAADSIEGKYLSNIRQVGLAVQLYAGDNRDSVPMNADGGAAGLIPCVNGPCNPNQSNLGQS